MGTGALQGQPGTMPHVQSCLASGVRGSEPEEGADPPPQGDFVGGGELVGCR
jgi:hypothetical protein